jgi:uncharacterized protein with GYD domain
MSLKKNCEINRSRDPKFVDCVAKPDSVSKALALSLGQAGAVRISVLRKLGKSEVLSDEF